MNEITTMARRYDRRAFCKTTGLGLGAVLLTPGAPGAVAKTSARRLKIGHTGITWGYKAEYADQAIKDLGSLGFQGYETFGEYFGYWEGKGGLGPLLDQAQLPLISAYCNVILTSSDAAARKAEVEKVAAWGGSIKKLGGTIAVIGPNGIPRKSYDFNAHKADIVATLNDMGKALADTGITAALHPHTGTCIEKSDEVYAVLEAVDTTHFKFAPDVGQFAKGGDDPVKILQHFIELVAHVHIKDWDGGHNWGGYCPVGTGKVAIPEILNLLEKSDFKGMIMVELDYDNKAPVTPIETARVAKTYLEKQGYTFRS